jgi:hypothetical protein
LVLKCCLKIPVFVRILWFWNLYLSPYVKVFTCSNIVLPISILLLFGFISTKATILVLWVEVFMPYIYKHTRLLLSFHITYWILTWRWYSRASSYFCSLRYVCPRLLRSGSHLSGRTGSLMACRRDSASEKWRSAAS